jgi:7,8-dihydropterin-6-yl-methyl-4-(beta-D-ribofuranosyl)aminobenzene 5'-phosphate synthase
MASLTILVDNCVRARGLVAQHGFSVWIEAGPSRILFDTGADERVLTENASRLGVDLATATDVVLSHGHWDHGGGLRAAMDACASARVWIPSGALLPRWHRDGSHSRDIALSNEVRERLVVDRKRWAEVMDPVALADKIWITGPVPGIRPEWTHRSLMRNEILDIPDEIPEEQALVIDTAAGLVVVVGCAHFGMDNLLERLNVLFPKRPLRSIVGGFHLESAPEQELSRLASRLREAGARCVVPCHCSGPAAAYKIGLAEGFGCEPGMVGKVLSFPD